MTRIEFEELTTFLAGTPLAIRQLVDGLGLSEWRWKPPGSDFSVVENVCHLRDIEIEGYAVRIDRVLNEDRPILADIDGSQLAEERNYNSQDLNLAIESFAQTREGNVRLIQASSPEQLERTGTLEGVGEISLGRLLELMREHDNAHLDELATLRARLAHSV